MLIVHVTDGRTDLDASTLSHAGKTYKGPVFDVPAEVGVMLTARPAFRAASDEDVAAVKPKPRSK